jgi:hypothetical protein
MATYMIFARKEYTQPLEHIGMVTVENGPTSAPTADLVRRAQEQFGGEGWVEMIAIPEAATLRVIPME